jgi:hypothetical protein
MTICAKDVNAQTKQSGPFGGKILFDYLLFTVDYRSWHSDVE